MKSKKGARIRALEDTCQRVAEIASAIQDQDVYLRFLNSTEDRHLNKLSPTEIRNHMKKVKYYGWTRLGNALRTKIVQPLIFDPLENGLSAKPVITIVVTDGHVSGAKFLQGCHRANQYVIYVSQMVRMRIALVRPSWSARRN